MIKKRLVKEEALQKLRHYCSYQERSHKEVKEKLYSFGLSKQDVEESISSLIAEDYLNEERYAQSFARGHFRTKHWGKVKIVYELKQKGVSAYFIQRALNEIDDGEYEKTLINLISKKASILPKNGKKYIIRQKIADYVMQKGYEVTLVQRLLTELGH
jgi:regulatory protein